MKHKRKKRWLPKKLDEASQISFMSGCFDGVECLPWEKDEYDKASRRDFGVYKTEAEALEMMGAIKKFVTKRIGEE